MESTEDARDTAAEDFGLLETLYGNPPRRRRSSLPTWSRRGVVVAVCATCLLLFIAAGLHLCGVRSPGRPPGQHAAIGERNFLEAWAGGPGGSIALAGRADVVVSVMTAGDGPFYNGSGVHLYKNVHASSQRWVIQDSFIKLAREKTLVLSVVPSPSGVFASGDGVEIYQNTGGANQKWVVQEGLIKLAAKPSLVLSAAYIDAPERLELRKLENSDAQRWIVPAPRVHTTEQPKNSTGKSVHAVAAKPKAKDVAGLTDASTTAPRGAQHAEEVTDARSAASRAESPPTTTTTITTSSTQTTSAQSTSTQATDANTTTLTTSTNTMTTKVQTTTTVETERMFWQHVSESNEVVDEATTFAEIVHRDGMCLEGPTGQSSDVHLARCGGGHEALQWAFDGAMGHIRNRRGGCLALGAAGESGVAASIQPCIAKDSGQQWRFDGHTGEIRNGENSCLEAAAAKAGQMVQLGNCVSGQSGQHWNIVQAACKQIRSRHGVCVDAPDHCKNHGTVHMWKCFRELVSQQWIYDLHTGHIKNSHGLCLAAAHEQSNHSKVFMYRCNVFLENQKWIYDEDTGLIKSRKGHCLTTSSSTQDGSELYLTNCNTSNVLQHWELQEKACSAGDVEFCEPCTHHFWPPPPKQFANEHNGARLPDVCFDGHGVHKVFVIGDWGGMQTKRGLRPADDRGLKKFPANHREFIVGVDDCAQQRVATQMRARALVSNPDYIINAGDNFYWGGVNDHCGKTVWEGSASEQWQGIFEQIYTGKGIDGKPWLGVLGNHDYGGYMFTGGWDQTISYTWHHEGSRWITPAQYWRCRVIYPTFSVDYFFVDSNYFDTGDPATDPGHNICNNKHNAPDASCGAEGPTSVADCPGWFSRLWQDQSKWLDGALAESQTDWQIVVTHFPPSWGADYWADLSHKHGIDLFISGHIHSQELHHLEATNFLRPTAYIVSGGGGGITSEGVPTTTGDDDQYGFFELTLSRTEIEIRGFSHGGQLRLTSFLHQRQHSRT